MADASRFPGLALPFAVVGGAAGWLSSNLLANPLLRVDPRGPMQPVAAVVAAACATIAGSLLRRACVGRRYAYSLVEAGPGGRPAGDVWWRHLAVMLGAGAVTGTLVSWICDGEHELVSAVIGAACTVVFVPVGFAVIAAGRRAQRARLGSVVADCDRRAVWSVLAITLGVTTVEAVPDWPAAAFGHVPSPMAALGVLAFAGLVVVRALYADLRGAKLAEEAIARRHRDHAPDAVQDEALPRLDLGLGDEVAASIAASPSPYRGVDRAIALVRGSPTLVRKALGHAIRRGLAGLAVLGAVACLHGLAHTALAREAYASLRVARIQMTWLFATSEPEPPADAPRILR